MTALDASLLGITYRGAPHVESWFLKATEPTGARGIWVKGTIFAREGSPPVAEAWAVAFDREAGHAAAKSTVPLESARFARGAVDVAIDGCELSLGRARGELSTGERTIRWDLAIGPERASPIEHLPARALYSAAVPTSKLVTPLADTRVSGSVRVQVGARTSSWELDAWPAMLGHNWGRGHPGLYAWSHCNSWEDAEDLVVEGVSARLRVGPLLTPVATSIFVRHRGRSIELRALLENRGTISLRRWDCVARSGKTEITYEVDAETDAFVGLHYPNPSGSMTYCLGSQLARAHVEMKLPDGETISATSRAAALEIGTRDPSHGVRMVL